MIACTTCGARHTRGPTAPPVGVYSDPHRCARGHHFLVPRNLGVCAHCVEERTDLELVSYDGTRVWMCGDCREGDVRGGSYFFGGSMRSPDRATNANGNKWRGASR